jgi:hypothetical protein
MGQTVAFLNDAKTFLEERESQSVGTVNAI